MKSLIFAIFISISPLGLLSTFAQPRDAAGTALQQTQTILRNMGTSGGTLQYSPPPATCGFSILANVQSPQGLNNLIVEHQGYAFIRTNPELYCPLTLEPNRVPAVLTWEPHQLQSVPAEFLLFANKNKPRLTAASIRSQCMARLAALESIQINRAQTSSIEGIETNTVELETTTRRPAGTATCREIMNVQSDPNRRAVMPRRPRRPVVPAVRVPVPTPWQGYQFKGTEAQ